MPDECICIAYGLKFMRPNSSCQYFLFSKVAVCKEKCVSQTNVCWFWNHVLFGKQNHRGMWEFELLNAKAQGFRKHHTLIVGWERTIFQNPTRPELVHVYSFPFCSDAVINIMCSVAGSLIFMALVVQGWAPVSAGVNMNEIKLSNCGAFTRETFYHELK